MGAGSTEDWESSPEAEEQVQELEVLACVYQGDEMHVTQVGSAPASFCIRLSPTDVEDMVHKGARITMAVQYNRRYPRAAPSITFSDPENMEPEHVEELEETVKARVAECVAENEALDQAMSFVYQITEEIRSFLSGCSDPESLHEKMLKRQQLKEEEEAKAKAEQRDRKNHHLQAQITEEMHRKDTHMGSKYSLFDHSDSMELSPQSRRSRSRSMLTTSGELGRRVGVQGIMERKVDFAYSTGKLVGKGTFGVIYKGMNRATHSIIAISELRLPIKSLVSASARSQSVDMDVLQQRIDKLTTIRHESIATTQGCEIERSHDGDTVFRIFQDYIAGGSLDSMLRNFGMISESQLAKYTMQIVSAMAALHSNDLVHGSLSNSNIMFDSNGTVKLVDCGVKHALATAHHVIQPPHDDMVLSDIWDIGAAVVSMATAGKVLLFGQGRNRRAKAVALPGAMSSDAQEFVYVCTRGRGSLQSASQLLQQPFLAAAYHEHLANKRLSDLHSCSAVSLDVDSKLGQSPSSSSLLTTSAHISRYAIEFKEMEKLGKGGFGEVMKVRHLLDGVYYAVKRIPLDAESAESHKIFQEVKTLARLNHEHVVRYYHAWIEGEALKADAEDDDLRSSSHLMLDTDVVNVSSSEEEFDGDGWASDNEDDGVWDEPAGEGFDEVDDEELFDMFQPSLYVDEANEDAGFAEEEPANGAEDEEEEEEEEDSDGAGFEDEPSHDFAAEGSSTLYIQMEYCTNRTLLSVINEEPVDEDEVWRLFRQVVEGLDHIHQQGVVHRDLKPANIFLDKQDNVKIGDFGLATNSGMDLTSSLGFQLDASPDGDVGTYFYTAPEQGASKSYDHKVDIFSLGIIFLELIVRFKTRSERAMALTQLREGTLPRGVEDQFPQQAQLIKWMLQPDPLKRPSTTDLLNSGLLPHKFEDDMFERALQSVHQNTTTFRNVVKRLFSLPADQYLPYTYNSHERKPHGDGSSAGLYSSLQEDLDQRVVAVFHAHGARVFRTPLLIPRQKTHAETVNLLDESGTVVTLPFDLTLPLASHLALNNVESVRRYVFDTVYAPQGARGQPKHTRKCGFDLVGKRSLLQQHEVEVLAVTNEVLEITAAEIAGTYQIFVSHVEISKAMLSICGVDNDLAPQVCARLEKGLSHEWVKTANDLLQLGLSTRSVERLQEMGKLATPLSQALRTLTPLLQRNSSAMEAIRELQKLEPFLAILGISNKVRLGVGIVSSFDYADGLMFHALMRTSSGQRVVLASGCSYGKLVSNLAPPNSVAVLRAAVGVTFSLEKIYRRVLAARKRASATLAKASAIDVLVAAGAPSQPMLAQRLEMASKLWPRGIRCGYSDPDLSTSGSLHWHCASEGIAWLVTLHAKEYPGKVRVQHVVDQGGKEVTMHADNVAEYLLRSGVVPVPWAAQQLAASQEAVSEATRSGNRDISTSTGGGGGGGGSGGGSGTGAGTPHVEVIMLDGGDQQRSKAKRRMLGEVTKAVQPVIESLRRGSLPAYALEVPGEVLSQACGSPDFLRGGGRFAGKHRKAMSLLREELGGRGAPPLALLYSCVDGSVHLMQT